MYGKFRFRKIFTLAIAILATRTAQGVDLGIVNNALQSAGLQALAATPEQLANLQYALPSLTFQVGGNTYQATNQESFNSLVDAIINNQGADRISSDFSTGTISRTGNRGTCASPDGSSYPIGSYDDIERCLGLQTSADARSGASAVNQITYNSFFLNRPTTQIENYLRYMRSAQNARTNSPESDLTSRAAPDTAGTGGASGDGYHYQLEGDKGLFFSAGGSFGDVNTQPGISGYSQSRRHVSVGADFGFTDWLTSGLLFNYTSTSANLAQTPGSFSSDIFRFVPYVSITPFDNAYIDLSAGYGYHQNQSTRSCQTCMGSAQGNFSANEVFGTLGLGYSYRFSGWTATGYGNGSVIAMDINGYSENATGTLSKQALKVSSQYPHSVTTALGTEVTYTFETSWGFVLPRVFGEWMHEYANSQHAIRAELQGSTIPVFFATANPVRNWANVGLGVQIMVPENSLSTFINYQSLIYNGASNHTIEGGLRWQF